MSIKADISKSVAFLQDWRPEGPWALTSVHPDRPAIQGETFTDPLKVCDWLEERPDWNHYFHVNGLMRSVKTKAKKSDVASLDWLHVDIDPEKRFDLSGDEQIKHIREEQKRILKLAERPPEGIPAPTVVLFSGGGYQLFWKLKEPIQLNGDVPRAEKAELYNLQLEIEFGADPCHNADRIMRLPGTVNWPNQKKRDAGRVPALARVVEWRKDAEYDISQFLQAPDPADEVTGGGRHEITVSDNVKRFGSVEELPEALSNRAKVIIVQGTDPDKPLTGDNSRSEWLFHACCAMVRAEMTDDEIYSVVTDPGFEISSSVLDKGTRIKSYAMRQIERARDAAIDPNLDDLNRKYAVIKDIGGRCRIMVESIDPILKRRRTSYQSAADFSLAFQNETVVGFKSVTDGQGNTSNVPVDIPKAKWWLSHSKRRQYNDVVFFPGGNANGSYNLWRGFSVDAKQGDCSLYLKHILDNVCSGHQHHYNYLLNWMATCVQKPADQGHVAVVLQGARGTGKSFFADKFGKLFGSHYIAATNPKHIMGAFNAHLQSALVLFADEAFVAQDRRAESILKTLITERQLTIEAKGIDARICANFLHVIMASNDDWVVPAGEDERRFFVLRMGEDNKQDSNYFGEINDQLKDGGYEALLHTLLTRDLAGWDVRKVPNTKALQEQKMRTAGSDPLKEWWLDCLDDGELVPGLGWPKQVFVSELVNSMVTHSKTFASRGGGTEERRNKTIMGAFLNKFFKARKGESQGLYFERKRWRSKHGTYEKVIQYNGEELPVSDASIYMMPTLAEARQRWDENFGTGDLTWSDTPDGYTPLDARFGDGEGDEF